MYNDCGDFMEHIFEIKDFNAAELDIYARYNEAQLLHYYEPNGGIFIAESPLVIERALNAGCEPISFLIEKKDLDTHAASLLERCPQTPVYTAELGVLTKLTGYHLARGALCAFHRPKPLSIETILTQSTRIAILENVMNPTNIGAIFRSAAALNIDAVILTSGCSDPLYRRASRVSMGTVFQIPWTYLDSQEKEAIEFIQRFGFKTAAMALCDDTLSIDDPLLSKQEKLAIVLGTEGEGLSKKTIEACDYTVKIPMAHGVDSLNVAAASAVAFWELSKKQKSTTNM